MHGAVLSMLPDDPMRSGGASASTAAAQKAVARTPPRPDTMSG